MDPSNSVAYWNPPDENPNFVARPPDPGMFDLYKTVGYEGLYHSPFNGVRRFTELDLEKMGGNKISPDEANQRFGLGGELKFDEPITEAGAQMMYRRKVDELDRNYLIARGSTTGVRSASGMVVGMASSMLDPINFASMFIPVAGEARIARFAGQFKSPLAQRLAAGALTGLSGSAMVEPFILLPALQEQANYSLKDSATNLGFGAAFGGLLHAGLGAIGDRMKKLKPKDSDQLFESAMNNVLKDEPVTSPAKIGEFIPEIKPETIQSAATRMKDGTILTGNTHFDILEKIDEHNLSQGISDPEYSNVSDQGFLTSTGRLVTREEATRIAEESGQIPKGLLKPNEGLAAESLQLGYEGEVKSEPSIVDLQKKISDEQIQEKQESKVNQDIKENKPSITSDPLRDTSETSKAITDIDQHTAEIEKQLNLEPEEKTALQDRVKSEVGDPKLRETGVLEGIRCIIKNLL